MVTTNSAFAYQQSTVGKGQTFCSPVYDDAGRLSSVRLLRTNRLITTMDFATASRDLATRLRTNLMDVFDRIFAELPAEVLGECLVEIRKYLVHGESSSSSEGSGRDDVQILINQVFDMSSYSRDSLVRYSIGASSFYVQRHWVPVLALLSHLDESPVDTNCAHFGNLITLMHVRNGAPPRTEDYMAFGLDGECKQQLSNDGLIYFELPTLKSTSAIRSVFYTMDNETTAFFSIYFCIYGKPELKEISTDTLVSFNLSRSFGFQFSASQYRKVAGTFASQVDFNEMYKSKSDADFEEKIHRLFEVQEGHSVATNRGIHYASLDPFAQVSHIASAMWRKLICHLPFDYQHSVSPWRRVLMDSLATETKSVIDDVVGTLQDPAHREEMRNFLVKVVDVDNPEIADFHTCGFGKSCGYGVLAKIVAGRKPYRDDERQVVVIVVVPTRKLGSHLCESYIIVRLGVRAVCWFERTQLDDVPDDVNIVFTCPESVYTGLFQSWYCCGKYTVSVFYDEVHEAITSHNYRSNMLRCAAFLRQGASVPFRMLSGSIPLRLRGSYLKALGFSPPWIETGAESLIIDDKKQYFVHDHINSAADGDAELLRIIRSRRDSENKMATTKTKFLVIFLYLTYYYAMRCVYTLGFICSDYICLFQVICLSEADVTRVRHVLAAHLNDTIAIASAEDNFCEYVQQWMESSVVNICVCTTVFQQGMTNRFCDTVIHHGGAYSLLGIAQGAGRAGRGNLQNRPVPQHHLIMTPIFGRIFGAKNTERLRKSESNAVMLFTELHDRDCANMTHGPQSVQLYSNASKSSCCRIYLKYQFNNVESGQVCNKCKFCLSNQLINASEQQFQPIAPLSSVRLHLQPQVSDTEGAELYVSSVLQERDETIIYLAKISELLRAANRHCLFCRQSVCDSTNCDIRRTSLGKPLNTALCFQCDFPINFHPFVNKRRVFCPTLDFKTGADEPLQICARCFVPVSGLCQVYSSLTGNNDRNSSISLHVSNSCVAKDDVVHARLRAVALYSIQRVILRKTVTVQLLTEFWNRVQENRVAEVLNMSWLARGYERISVTHSSYRTFQMNPNRNAPNGYDTNLGQAIINATLPSSLRATVRRHSRNGVRGLQLVDNEAVKRRRVTSSHPEVQQQRRIAEEERKLLTRLNKSITSRNRNTDNPNNINNPNNPNYTPTLTWDDDLLLDSDN